MARWSDCGEILLIEKICSKCKEVKNLSDFHKGRNKDGKQSQCRACRKIICFLSNKKNWNKRLEYQRKWRIKSGGNARYKEKKRFMEKKRY